MYYVNTGAAYVVKFIASVYGDLDVAPLYDAIPNPGTIILDGITYLEGVTQD